jgi:hypothetical protein
METARTTMEGSPWRFEWQEAALPTPTQEFTKKFTHRLHLPPLQDSRSTGATRMWFL